MKFLKFLTDLKKLFLTISIEIQRHDDEGEKLYEKFLIKCI